MELDVFRLIEDMADYSRFVLYGCGEIAKKTYNYLKKMNYIPEYCVITLESSEEKFFEDDIPIYGIENCVNKIVNEKIMLLLAVNESNAKEIMSILKKYNIKNHIAIMDYIIDRHSFFKQYLNMSIEEYTEKTAKWRINSHVSLSANVSDEVKNIKKYINHLKTNKKKIVFGLGLLAPRVIKIAKALIGSGYKIEMIAEPGAIIQDICLGELQKLGINLVYAYCIEDFTYKVLSEEPALVHLFTQRGQSDFDRILFNIKDILPPIIFDQYDIVGNFYTNVSEETIYNEKYCLEHADAICNRGAEIDYLKEKQNYQIVNPVLHLPDYCGERFFNSEQGDGVLSICYSGIVIPSRNYPEFWESVRELAKRCKENSCHFHVYPTTWNEDLYKDYIELSGKNSYFHFHKTISYEILSREISRYDYGVFPILKPFIEKGWIYNTKEKLIYGTTNKYFDYIEAGLPVISAVPKYAFDFLRKKGIMLDWTIEDYNFNELRIKKSELKERVIAEREKLKMSNHIYKLIELYDAIT